jgi:dipeptidyl aminopeptidase/acylaminoacyl peptidase
MRLQRVADVQVSPDGHYVAFSVSEPDVQANRLRTGLWLLDLTKSADGARRLIPGSADDWNGRWMPDSRGLYFISTRSGSSQVWQMSLDRPEAVQVTRLPLDVDTLKVSPRGDRLLASIEVFPGCPDLDCTAKRLHAAEISPGSGRVYDRLFVRHWNRWKDGRQSHLFSLALSRSGDSDVRPPVDLSGRLDADVPSKPRGGDEEFNFNPDGSRVVFTARIKGKTEAWSTNFDVYEIAADGRDEPRNLTADNPAWDTQPTYSPDGRLLAWKAMDRPQNEADRFHLMVKDLKSGAVRALARDWDRSISQFAFTADGRHILATTDHLGQHPLWSIDVASGKPTLVHAQGQVTEFATGPRFAVYALGALDEPGDLYRVATRGGRPDRLTHLNAGLLGGRSLSAFEQFSFKGWNGEPVYGYVVQPFGFVPGRKYPVAFIVHGGPQLSYSNGWTYRWNPQVYAGAGYAVVLIDFHGSTGYGQAFTDSISGDWGGKPLEDLRLGLAAALARYPWLDGERACALGASYSGYMMNWIEGNWPDRFRCLVNYAGPFDVRGLYYQTDEMWLDEFEFGGPQFENPAGFDKHNPMLHVREWRTPMLVGHGQLDFNVPYEQGVSAFTALQRRGIESRLLIFPDEGHLILKPQNSLQWHREAIAWLDRWFKRPETH